MIYRNIKLVNGYRKCCISNSYDKFTEMKFLDSSFRSNTDVNKFAVEVVKAKQLQSSNKINKYVFREVYLYKGEEFHFNTIDNNGSKYLLLVKAIDSNEIINSYDAFDSYIKLNKLRYSFASNIPFQNDLSQSIESYSENNKYWKTESTFNFIELENISKPNQYFHFIKYGNTTCVTNYIMK